MMSEKGDMIFKGLMAEKNERILKGEISRQSGLKKFNDQVAKFNESKMVECWKVMYEYAPRNILSNMIWEWINNNPSSVFWKGESRLVGHLTVIKPYKDRNGNTKPAHFSINDKYIGSCKTLGDKPTSYTCYFPISQAKFNLNIEKILELTLFDEVFSIANLFTPKEELAIGSPPVKEKVAAKPKPKKKVAKVDYNSEDEPIGLLLKRNVV